MTLAVDAGVQLGPLPLAVQLEVQAGEVLAVLGPNGAGKSSLLRVVAGLVAVDRGAVHVDGTVLDDPEQNVFVPPERRPVGMVFQDHLLFTNLTALENVAFGLRARGVAKALARRRAAELLERMGLTSHAAARPAGLSGGQAQRVALARALATDPRVLLLDEPLSALDATTRTGVRRDLRHHLDDYPGMTIVVTHDPVDAYALADRVAVVDQGVVVQDGTIADVTAHPRSRYVADLVGTNLVTGSVTGGVLTTRSGAQVVVAGADAGPSFAVVRPRSITVQRHADHDSSVRNAWPGTVATIDLLGDRARVGIAGALPLTAEITAAALTELALRPGDPVVATAKATDIIAYPGLNAGDRRSTVQGIAAIAEAWLTQRREGAVARVIAADGLGPRPTNDILLIDRNGSTGGSLLAGAVQQEVITIARDLLQSGGSARRVGIDVDPVDATAAGLTCAGRVEVLVQRLDAMPRRLWDVLAAGRPAALVTALGASPASLAAVVVEPGGQVTGTLGDSGLDTIARSEADAALSHTGTTVTTVAVGTQALLVEAWNPIPRLVIVGASDLAVALTRQAELLGWSASTTVTADDAVAAIGELTGADMVVVIEHDPFIGTPTLAATLRGGVGYVGALGSRRTQANRHEHLTDVGIPEADIARVHGPTGLDLGARSPAETAVSIVAEVIAVRSGRSGQALTSTTGRITG